MAWSYIARFETPGDNNSPAFARDWAHKVQTCELMDSQPAML